MVSLREERPRATPPPHARPQVEAAPRAPRDQAPASLIIPAYNEEAALGSTLEEIVARGFHERYEVLVVDDGSTDRTAEIARSFPGIRVLRHARNRGYGAALKTGVRHARTPKVVFMDGDGQHSPEQVDDVVHLLDRYPMVIGERDRESYQAPRRLLGKRVIRCVGEYLLGQKLPDFNSGFRGFHRALIRSLLGILPSGFSFSTTSTMAAIQRGHDYGTVPIHVRPRAGRPSSVRFLRDGLKTALLVLRIVMLFNPLRVFVPASAFFTLLGLAWGAYGIAALARLPNSAVLVTVLGMFLFFIGLLADQISLVHLGREPLDDGAILDETQEPLD